MKDLQSLLKDNFKSIQSVLPSKMDPSRFCRMAINAVQKNPALAECNPSSFVMAVINMAEIGLEPSLGQAALVPYSGIVQCQPMYQGLMELARRSGQVVKITADVVREGDEFRFTKGLEPTLDHVPKAPQSAALTHAYAVAKLADGEIQFEVMAKDEIEKVKKVSKAAGKAGSPWNTWPEQMWKKTVLKRLCNMLPRSNEMSRAMDLDDLAMSGKAQPPVFADMTGATIDVEAVAGEPQGEGEIKQPQEKKPAKEKPKADSKLKKGKVSVAPAEPPEEQGDEHQELVVACKELEEKLGAQAILRAKQTAGIDEAEDLTYVAADKLENLVHLYKVALNS